MTHDVLTDAKTRAAGYLAALPERKVRPDHGAVARLSMLDTELLEEGPPDGEMLRLLDECGSPVTMANFTALAAARHAVLAAAGFE